MVHEAVAAVVRLLEAMALALRAHPQFNASLDAAAGELILKRYYHLGVAVATERGLIVPVLRAVDRKPGMEIARELGALAQRVRDGKATIEDLRGGTFTISNIGALGGTGAIPIINYPEVAILGVARAREEAVVREGQIVPRLIHVPQRGLGELASCSRCHGFCSVAARCRSVRRVATCTDRTGFSLRTSCRASCVPSAFTWSRTSCA